MKRINLIVLALIVVSQFTLSAQAQNGIHFENGLSWQQIVDKAKAEHKYIFVDCYATWCVPCKWMEQNVYTLKDVGDTYNKDFISVKVQMDQTKSDNDTVKSWYDFAKNLETNYTIDAYPAFLFFDINGHPVHKATGSLQPPNFIGLAADAQNPDKQYYIILKNFQPGTTDTAKERELISAVEGQDHNLAGTIAADYLSRIPENSLGLFSNGKIMWQYQDNLQIQGIAKAYINSLTEKQIYEPKTLEFIRFFTNTPNDRGFDIYYHHKEKVDAVTKDKRLATDQVIKVISAEEFDPIYIAAKITGNEPDWQTICQTIARKYDTTYARMVIINSKLTWFNHLVNGKKDAHYWTEYITAGIAKIQAFRQDTISTWANSHNLNEFSWDIFLHGENKAELITATGWMKEVIKKKDLIPVDWYFGALDTYACLLYKAGKNNEAINVEKKGLQLATNQKDKNMIDHDTMTIDKMKKGEKIWLEKEYQN